ncbi:MAG TPA: TerC family protein [Longimicrobiales bacterium]|nr:TerC family protein [Longimicrobiales bacterium]
MTELPWLWIGFTVFIGAMLAVDLGVLNREAHVVRIREAARWTVIVVASALLFNAWIFAARGTEDGLEFLTGYVIELALSMDNIFVFIVIFAYFRVPREYQHRVLFWGILGALVMRGAMIAAGWLLLERFQWIIYVFGAFLLVTGVRTSFGGTLEVEPEANPFLKLIRRFVPVSERYEGSRFFVRVPEGTGMRLVATPMLVVLVIVETTDVIFAVDSIPAVFGITTDPFIVFTSNVFAILGLRSMYFLLAGTVERFHYLKLGMAAVLTFIGAKMVATYWDVHVPIGASLGVVGILLGTSIVASLVFPKPEDSGSETGETSETTVP